MYVVNLVNRYMERPTELHLQSVKRILRYLKGTTELGIFYSNGGDEELVGYTDSDYAGDVEDRKSTMGYMFMLSSGVICWASKKQPVVTLSTTEVEFLATASCSCQAVWLRRLLEELGYVQHEAIVIYCDSSSAIKLSRNSIMHGHSKHIDVRFYFLRDLSKDGMVKMVHCRSQEQVADIMNKPLKLDMLDIYSMHKSI
ncbi:secreted RxLR effector protein 161-like [Tripterygium wilfordii]|uniref:secreted RxLR effector protein 161-like n=1 Tax=Tripterygium wilfordii TaxID=458696 RepID=UPI0018F811EF|nr:secreted RxLR effector protein 161-like [Tripterygium wilfordii]